MKGSENVLATQLPLQIKGSLLKRDETNIQKLYDERSSCGRVLDAWVLATVLQKVIRPFIKESREEPNLFGLS
ncbi:unnamed protein product [Clavelina lepadiformis]|uniref:Uncharacterized protein n=1 Tax=Clavelina lepadiformis TaxID=159417 RepID=A0ABP0F334_CLALP